MSQLAEWLKSKNITSHTIVAVLVAGATLITTDEQVRSLLVGMFINHPKVVTDLTIIAGIVLKYSRDSSTRGAALNILSDANQAQPAPVIVTPPATVTKETTAPLERSNESS